jgi:hypothetical protein
VILSSAVQLRGMLSEAIWTAGYRPGIIDFTHIGRRALFSTLARPISEESARLMFIRPM